MALGASFDVQKALGKIKPVIAACMLKLRALQEPGTKRHYSGKINEEKYHLAARCQQLGGYLKVSICTREDIIVLFSLSVLR